jgi:cell division transport system permease protein
MKAGGTTRKKKTLGSYPYFSVIFSVTLALFVVGIFGLIYQYSGRLGRIIRENLAVQVYLDKNLPESQQLRINRVLTTKPYIVQSDQQPEIEFISEQEAALRFTESTGEEFTEFLGENPLRAAFNIRISAAYQLSDSLARIKTELEKIEGIHEVVYVPSLVDSINRNMARISLLLGGIFIILITVVVILINNTMKLALFSQRFLIRSMQLVGARQSFILAPFLQKSLLHGAIAGILASTMIYLASEYAARQISDLQALHDTRELLLLFILVLFMGMAISGISTLFAVNKYLKMSLDDLY